MTERTRPKEFGQRRPAAVGAGAYALMPRQSCEPATPGMAAPALPQPDARCGSSGSSGGGGHGGSSRYSFSGGDQSGGSASSSASDSTSGGATRGGFGSLAHAFGLSGGG